MMTDMRTALVGWKKGMTSIAQTYIVEIEGATAHFTRVGPGGAHWSPDYLSMGMAANGMNPNNPLERRYAMLDVQVSAGSGLGAIAGDKILDKFRKEITANVEIYETQGRTAVSHKSNMSIPAAEIAAASFVDKLPGGAPPALRTLEGPHVETQIGGKRWFLFQLPDTPMLSDLIAAAAAS
jgi:hypothetical protein